MTSSARKILEEALALPEAEREELVAALSDSLSPDAVELSPEGDPAPHHGDRAG